MEGVLARLLTNGAVSSKALFDDFNAAVFHYSSTQCINSIIFKVRKYGKEKFKRERFRPASLD
jgi:hypothetical protein